MIQHKKWVPSQPNRDGTHLHQNQNRTIFLFCRTILFIRPHDFGLDLTIRLFLSHDPAYLTSRFRFACRISDREVKIISQGASISAFHLKTPPPPKKTHFWRMANLTPPFFAPEKRIVRSNTKNRATTQKNRKNLSSKLRNQRFSDLPERLQRLPLGVCSFKKSHFATKNSPQRNYTP